jgi:putative ABC transport system substrate-binding protein
MVELLRELAPGVRHLLAIYDPHTTPNKVYLETAQTATRAALLQLMPTPVQNDEQAEVAIRSFAQIRNRGLIVLPDAYTVSHRRTIIDLASEHRLPATYGFSLFAREGGLASYGPDPIDPFRRAASYVARILEGAKPGDLPVQQPTKFELVINLKTAKALGLTVPATLIARADEVIE